MHGTLASEKPPIIKHRTISLTNRAPIRVVEDEWPILAQGQYGQSHYYQGEEYGHLIQIILRQHKNYSDQKRRHDVDEILHAKYEFSQPCGDGDCSVLTIRVGRLLAFDAYVQDGRLKCQSIDDQWRHIREVGEELRERIMHPEHKKHVTHAVDRLFANLPPHGM